MTSKQMQHLTTNAASSISRTQMEGLSSDQKDAIELAITGLKYTKPSSSTTLSSTQPSFPYTGDQRRSQVAGFETLNSPHPPLEVEKLEEFIH